MRRRSKNARPAPIPEDALLEGMSRALKIDVTRLELRHQPNGSKVLYLDGEELVINIQPSDDPLDNRPSIAGRREFNPPRSICVAPAPPGTEIRNNEIPEMQIVDEPLERRLTT